MGRGGSSGRRGGEGGTGTTVGHYGSVYDSSLFLMDTDTQMELYFEPEGEGVNGTFDEKTLLNMPKMGTQPERKSHLCKTCRFLYFLSCRLPPV